jgi:glycosyltransferase involved in cell wall biosynthesis
MKIRLVITNTPPLVGGLEKVCLRLAQNCQKLGHEVQILGRFSEKRHRLEEFFSASEKPKGFLWEGVSVRIFTLDDRARLLLKPVFKLIWRKCTFPIAKWLYVVAMREQIANACRGAEVVHFFGNGPEMLGFAAESAARKVGARFVVEPALHEGQWGDKWIDAILYKKADLILAHSKYEAGVLERMGIPAAKIRTILHGVDFCDSGDGRRFRRKLGIGGSMVLFLGRKTKEKGVERLLNAWPLVAAKFPEATLVIAGPKSTLGVLEDFRRKIDDRVADGATKNTKLRGREERGTGSVERGVEKNQPLITQIDTDESGKEKAGLRPGSRAGAEFSNPSTSELARDSENTSPISSANGPAFSLANSYPLPVTAPGARILNLNDLTDEEKQDALAACDVLCVPSKGESFGMVYFEAWAYGKPVVGLDLPVLRETIKANEAGILVRERFDELADAVCQLLGDFQLRHEMGKNGRKAAQQHSWEAAVMSYFRTYGLKPY